MDINSRWWIFPNDPLISSLSIPIRFFFLMTANLLVSMAIFPFGSLISGAADGYKSKVFHPLEYQQSLGCALLEALVKFFSCFQTQHWLLWRNRYKVIYYIFVIFTFLYFTFLSFWYRILYFDKLVLISFGAKLITSLNWNISNL